jgi:hypothetical protein
MNITIYSIPHSGTRFVESFFRHCGVMTSRRHVGYKLVGKDGVVPDGHRIIPIRNPYQCYMSNLYRRRAKFSDAEFIGYWGKLMLREGFHFPIETKNRLGVMRAALDYVGRDGPIETFQWEPVNTSNRPRDSEPPENIKKALDFAMEWYWSIREDSDSS